MRRLQTERRARGHRDAGLNGIDAASQIVKLDSRIQVVILSMHSDETYINRALTAGVKGYILEDSAESRTWSPRSEPPRRAARISRQRYQRP